MKCKNCGYQNIDGYQYCTKCGYPLVDTAAPGVFKAPVQPQRKRGLALFIAACAVVVAVFILVLALAADPVAGRWYSQNGTELIMLQNGKGMTVSGSSGDIKRVHFMYAIEYREAGYIEGEIYEQSTGNSTWFYLYDGALELGNEYFYRQKPITPMK